MSDSYLRLAERPLLKHPGYPICDACDVEVELDDGWLCPEAATLYPDWSGEELTGPICPNALAWRVDHYSGAERDRRVLELIEAEREKGQR